jgi:hypothetical protein
VYDLTTGMGMRVVVCAVSIAAAGLAACDKVKEPTPPGAVLFEWDRASAARAVMGKHPHQYPPHPLGTATLLEGPITSRFRIVSQPLLGQAVTFDVEIASANVSFEEEGVHTARWSPVHVKAILVSNDAYAVVGRCDDAVGIAKVAPGKVGDVSIDCRVVARRPNQLGEEDGLTATASMQIEGNARLYTNHIDVASVEPIRD